LRVLGNIKLIAEKGPHALHLQDALSVVHHGKFVCGHEFSATLSSDELEFLLKIAKAPSSISRERGPHLIYKARRPRFVPVKQGKLRLRAKG